MNVLYYVHDPMCSWCYAFAPVWERLRGALPPAIETRRLLGGLAPDDDQPMDPALRQRLQDTWRRIEAQVPGIRFNFDFWRLNTPRRSTWPACRALIAARRQGPERYAAMNAAIQRAYYQQARNPSDDATLIELAGELGFVATRFQADLNSAPTCEALRQEIEQARAMGVNSFPSLLLDLHGSRWPVAVDYRDSAPMLELIETLLQT